MNSTISFANPGLLINVTANARNLTLTPAAHFFYSAASIDLISSGYSFASAPDNCSGTSCIFRLENANPASFSINGKAGPMTFVACLNGKKQLSCQRHETQIPPHPYVTDHGGNVVYICDITNTGVITNCQPTPTTNAPAWIPYGIAFTTVNGTQYGYVADPSGFVYQCTLNTNGSFNDCTKTATETTFNHPTGITFGG